MAWTGAMLIHLPIVENRIAQFAARFERHGKGWVYYHGDRLTGGLPVSDVEHATLIAEHARLLKRAERVMRWWLPFAAVLCVVWELRFGGIERETVPWMFAPILLLPLPWVVREWRRADQLAMELAGRRMAVTPPRTWRQGTLSRIAAMPPGIGVMLLLVSALLAVQSRPWATDRQRWWLAEALMGMIGGGVILWLRRRGGRRR